MPADAIALLRPKDPEKLRPYLDLDDDEESDGHYAEELSDGAFMVHTFQPFAVFQGDHDEGRLWLEGLGDALPHAHDDSRGVLFFPDDLEPEGTTYEEIVATVEKRGIWIPPMPLGQAEAADRNARLAKDIEDAKRMVAALTGGEGGAAANPEELEALARRLQGSTEGIDPAFGVAKMFEDVQRQMMSALGLPAPTGDTIVVLVSGAPEVELDEVDVVDAFELGDGSVALQTYVPLASSAELLAELRGARAEWIAKHADPRGVPTFSSAHLDDLEDVKDYADVLARLGDEVKFLVP